MVSGPMSYWRMADGGLSFSKSCRPMRRFARVQNSLSSLPSYAACRLPIVVHALIIRVPDRSGPPLPHPGRWPDPAAERPAGCWGIPVVPSSEWVIPPIRR